MASRKIACVVVPALIALAFRFSGLTFDSFWLDEGYQTIVSAYGNPLPDFLRLPAGPFLYKPQAPASPRMMLANFRRVDPLTPPLYQLLLNRWITIFGGSDMAVRSLSAIVSSLSVGLLSWLAGVLFGWRCGLFAGLIQAFSPFDVYYGQEARMYALEELMAVISTGSLMLYLHGARAGLPARRRFAAALAVAYAASTWALINSHYTGLFLFAAQQLMTSIVALGRRSVAIFLWMVATNILLLVFWIPWLPMFQQAAALRTASFYVSREPSWLWPFIGLFARLPSDWVMFMSGNHVVTPALPLFITSFIVLLLGLLSTFAPHVVRTLFFMRRPIAFAFLFLAVVPGLILWLMDVIENHKVIDFPRYLIASAPWICLIGARGIDWLMQSRKRTAYLLLAGQLVFAAIDNIAHATVIHQREPWREMAALVQQMVPQSELLLVSQYFDIVCLDRYLQRPYRQLGVSSISTRRQLADALKGVDRFALITAQEGDRVLPALPPVYHATVHKDLGHSLHFYLFTK